MSLSSSIESWLSQAHPDARLLAHRPLDGGVSSIMNAFDVEFPSGETKTYTLRQYGAWSDTNDPDAIKTEYSLLTALAQSNVSAPRPQFLDTKKEYFEQKSLVLEFIEGTPLLAPTDLNKHLSIYANQLAAIHNTPSPEEAFPFLKPFSEEVSDHSAGMEARLNATFSYAECKASLKAIWPIPNLNPLSLVHGDYWPGNVLWKDEQLIAVIDWEETCIDDPLIDLAIARLDVRWVYGKEAMDTFTRLYLRANPIDSTHLPHWDLFAAIRPGDRLAEWAPGYPQLGRDDITADTMTLERREFAAEALRRLA